MNVFAILIHSEINMTTIYTFKIKIWKFENLNPLTQGPGNATGYKETKLIFRMIIGMQWRSQKIYRVWAKNLSQLGCHPVKPPFYAAKL